MRIVVFFLRGCENCSYLVHQCSCNLWYSTAVWPSTSSTKLPWRKLQSHLNREERSEVKLNIRIIEAASPRTICLLVSCCIHAHHQPKNGFTCGFHYSNSSHSSATASCLHVMRQCVVIYFRFFRLSRFFANVKILQLERTRYSTSRSSSKMRNPANEKPVSYPKFKHPPRKDEHLRRQTQTCHFGIEVVASSS